MAPTKISNAAKTILTIVTGFSLIFLITDIKGFMYASILIGALSLISDKIGLFVHFIWMKIAWLLSFIVPNILMSIIFYLFLSPIALLSRLFGPKNQLNIKNISPSLFKDKGQAFTKEMFEKPW